MRSLFGDGKTLSSSGFVSSVSGEVELSLGVDSEEKHGMKRYISNNSSIIISYYRQQIVQEDSTRRSNQDFHAQQAFHIKLMHQIYQYKII